MTSHTSVRTPEPRGSPLDPAPIGAASTWLRRSRPAGALPPVLRIMSAADARDRGDDSVGDEEQQEAADVPCDLHSCGLCLAVCRARRCASSRSAFTGDRQQVRFEPGEAGLRRRIHARARRELTLAGEQVRHLRSGSWLLASPLSTCSSASRRTTACSLEARMPSSAPDQITRLLRTYKFGAPPTRCTAIQLPATNSASAASRSQDGSVSSSPEASATPRPRCPGRHWRQGRAAVDAFGLLIDSIAQVSCEARSVSAPPRRAPVRSLCTPRRPPRRSSSGG